MYSDQIDNDSFWITTENHDLREAIKKLLSFQYKRDGYGHLTCSSCGAEGHEYIDEHGVSIRREACSRNCPWRVAEELAFPLLKGRRHMNL